ncbi:MAG: OHCU decarboxylase, partial [Bacteroidetes bacterium]|nr:OHCU decarboxylase [Bacteroidota bacterium]
MTIAELNTLSPAALRETLSRCCGATRWVEGMAAAFPIRDKQDLMTKAEKIWFALGESDWREAFTHHPKIGDISSLKEKFASTGKWAEGEQSSVRHTSEEVLQAL